MRKAFHSFTIFVKSSLNPHLTYRAYCRLRVVLIPNRHPILGLINDKCSLFTTLFIHLQVFSKIIFTKFQNIALTKIFHSVNCDCFILIVFNTYMNTLNDRCRILTFFYTQVSLGGAFGSSFFCFVISGSTHPKHLGNPLKLA